MINFSDVSTWTLDMRTAAIVALLDSDVANQLSEVPLPDEADEQTKED